jgi:threonine dehydratase
VYTLPLADILAARERIRGYVRHTPILPLPNALDDAPNLRLKLENLQVTGSFKPRGVFNTLLQLDEATRCRGVVAASGGNHGVALAYAAQRLNIPATVYLPATATADRVARVAVWGAKVEQVGTVWDDAHAAAVSFAERERLPYVHPFDADATLAGQGTLGLELLEDFPYMDAVLIAIGGSGLIAGMAAAIKAARPNVTIIGVEPTGAASMKAAVSAGRLVDLPSVRTIADTLSPRSVSQRTLDLTMQHVEQIALVDDFAMLEAMRWLWRHANQLVEPSGAAVIAAILTGAVDISAYRCPVALICGGNAAADEVFYHYHGAAVAKGR